MLTLNLNEKKMKKKIFLRYLLRWVKVTTFYGTIVSTETNKQILLRRCYFYSLLPFRGVRMGGGRSQNLGEGHYLKKKIFFRSYLKGKIKIF